MSEQTSKRRILFAAALLLVLAQSCVRVRLDAPAPLPSVQDIAPLITQRPEESLVGPNAKINTLTPTPVEIFPTRTALPHVTITAIKGNLFIRRGPDMAYNPVGVLYKDTTADAIARDVLAGWVEIVLTKTGGTGWVSVRSNFSRVEGDLHALPEFVPTDWPVAGYLRNCSHHEMYVQPGEIRLPSSLEYPENETWLYPGRYTVYDLDVADEPEVMTVEMHEGSDVEILFDGLGEHRKCP